MLGPTMLLRCWPTMLRPFEWTLTVFDFFAISAVVDVSQCS